MNERDFFYWLQGFFEISETETLSKKQIQVIKDHMALVATKVTPNRQEIPEDTEELQRRIEKLIRPVQDPSVICSNTNTKYC